MTTDITELLIFYLKLKIDKRRAVISANWDLACIIRDQERKLSLDISNILISIEKEPFIFETINKDADKLIEEYCLKNYDCSTYDSSKLLSLIKRQNNIDSLGI